MDQEKGTDRVSKHAWWEQRLEEWRSSGLSMRGYCRREGVSFNGLRYWKGKSQERQGERGAVKLAVSAAAAMGATRLIEVVVAERFTVKVPRGFEASDLERLIRSLEALR
jgi:hypothetical protein